MAGVDLRPGWLSVLVDPAGATSLTLTWSTPSVVDDADAITVTVGGVAVGAVLVSSGVLVVSWTPVQAAGWGGSGVPWLVSVDGVVVVRGVWRASSDAGRSGVVTSGATVQSAGSTVEVGSWVAAPVSSSPLAVEWVDTGDLAVGPVASVQVPFQWTARWVQVLLDWPPLGGDARVAVDASELGGVTTLGPWTVPAGARRTVVDLAPGVGVEAWSRLLARVTQVGTTHPGRGVTILMAAAGEDDPPVVGSAPGPVTGLTGTPTAGGVALAWTPPAGATAILVYRDGTPVALLGGTEVGWTDLVSSGVQRTWTVLAATDDLASTAETVTATAIDGDYWTGAALLSSPWVPTVGVGGSWVADGVESTVTLGPAGTSADQSRVVLAAPSPGPYGRLTVAFTPAAAGGGLLLRLRTNSTQSQGVRVLAAYGGANPWQLGHRVSGASFTTTAATASTFPWGASSLSAGVLTMLELEASDGAVSSRMWRPEFGETRDTYAPLTSTDAAFAASGYTADGLSIESNRSSGTTTQYATQVHHATWEPV